MSIRPWGCGYGENQHEERTKMKTAELENIVSLTIRNRISESEQKFFDNVNLLIRASIERESQSVNEVDKEFHKGVQAGMKHVLILLGNLEIK